MGNSNQHKRKKKTQKKTKEKKDALMNVVPRSTSLFTAYLNTSRVDPTGDRGLNRTIQNSIVI